MSELFHRLFRFLSMFACEDENLKFLSLQVHDLSYTVHGNEKNKTFLGFGLIISAHAWCNLLPLRSCLLQPLSLQP